MGWWIALGVVVFALVVLVFVSLPVLSRLGRLGRAAARTQTRVKEAETLRMSVAHLQERLDSVAEHAAGVQERVSARERKG
jgi:flagellar biosynthesis/type III secretory pathway M-ring protein FliF/YscJ